MKLNEILELEIIDDNHNGCGIAKVNNIPVFVFGTLKGDIVKVKITCTNKKYFKGEVISFISKSSLHIKPVCPYYEECGGCDLLHTSFDRENILKQNYIKKLFKDFDPKIIYFDRFNYRNKVTLHVAGGKLGFYKKNSNSLIEIDNCMLLDTSINDFISILKKLDLSSITKVIIKTCISGLLIKIEGNLSNSNLDYLSSLDNVLSIYINDDLAYGGLYQTKKMDTIKFNINGNSFFQVNDECAKALYDKVKEYVGYSNKLLDLYCGTASIGIYLSDICKEIVGVEINKDSINCAKENIKNNNILNYKIIHGDASIIEDNFDIVVVDPPRSGLSNKVISNLKKINSEKIIYVSCNPSTLKRDIDLLDNYYLEEICAFNMFPGTHHVECVTLLIRK